MTTVITTKRYHKWAQLIFFIIYFLFFSPRYIRSPRDFNINHQLILLTVFYEAGQLYKQRTYFAELIYLTDLPLFREKYIIIFKK